MSFDDLVDRVFSAIPVIGPWYQTVEGRKKVRYALVSVVAVPIGTIAVAFFNVVGLAAGWAAVCGNSIGAIPSYLLNRYWVWGKTGRNSVMTEILPFWVITLIGIAFSLETGHRAGQFAKHQGIHGVVRLGILLVANVAGFAVLWVAKYVLFNKLLFVVKESREGTTSTTPGPS